MKKIALITILLFISSFTIFGQKQEHECNQREQIKAQKVSFITEKLNLTVEEAQKFWPVYNKYSESLHEVEKDQRKLMNKFRDNKETLSDNEVKAIYVSIIELQTKEVKLNNEMQQELVNIISIRKMMELQMAERMFKHELLNKIKHCKVAE
ncbi:MAG: hypothetical protein CVU05_11215 [Bacteroidetes bacterium HGW-Bacteroidetes-21]|jgi:hypothetical protein|nr:MAG: hypothetical protein CVU05_11215 [Bacteroidetes bacterium HGW-Bacteroidetes-21]